MRGGDRRDASRFSCPSCGHTWPRRFGRECFRCGASAGGGSAPAVIVKGGSGTAIRLRCEACGRSWPRRFSGRCHGCDREGEPAPA